jgi:hypothetical protein
MLAYINPREAALLKAHGGSGKPHADTGIPSFEETDIQESVFDPSGTSEGSYSADTYAPDTMTYGGVGEAARSPVPTSGNLGTDVQLSSFPQARETQAFDTSRPVTSDAITRQLMEGGTPDKAPPKGGVSQDMLSRLGIAGISGLLGAKQARAAEKSGQAGAKQMQQLAAPYQQKGQELQAQAQRGELTPQAMQSLQAAQAQVAQGVQNRGGVGAAQAQMQIEQLRQNLLQGQYDYGLKLSGIGDQIALGAIKTGMQADQYANQLTSSYFNNIARTIFGQGGQTPPPKE